MATIKSHTDMPQSEVLSKILPRESADMFIDCTNPYYIHTELKHIEHFDSEHYPCWSLAALLDIIPKHIKDYNVLRIDIDEKGFSLWYDEVGYGVNDKLPDITMECLVDACVAMIEKLHELGML